MARTWRTATTPRVTADEQRFSEFAGVVNTQSRRDIGLKALYVGDNVYISDTKKVTRRAGYTPYRETGTVWSAYGETGRLYVVDNGALVAMDSPTQDIPILSGLSNRPFCWDHHNKDAYFVNGLDAGIVRGATALPWRLTTPQIVNTAVLAAGTNTAPFQMGASYAQAQFRILATHVTADGRETAPSEIVTLTASPLTTLIRVTCSVAYAKTNVYCTEPDGTVFRFVGSTTAGTVTFNPTRGGERYDAITTQSLPEGVTHVAFCGGLCFVGRYDPAARASGVWMSEGFAFHRFNVSKDMQAIPGELALLLWNNAGVLIGTTDSIYQYDPKTDELKQLVDYGVVKGVAGDCDAQGLAYFWTERGFCQAMPFKNLTEERISMAPGSSAVGSMLYLNGVQQFVVVTRGGGNSFNSRRERT